MSWHTVASHERLLKAHPWLPVVVAGRELVLARFEGTWYAVDANCTHAGCAFADEASLEGPDIVCNCHGSEFDLRTGALLRGPAERPIRSYPVRPVEDGLEVDL